MSVARRLAPPSPHTLLPTPGPTPGPSPRPTPRLTPASARPVASALALLGAICALALASAAVPADSAARVGRPPGPLPGSVAAVPAGSAARVGPAGPAGPAGRVGTRGPAGLAGSAVPAPAAAARPAASTVVVPRVTRTLGLVAAYARLHRAGLRMAVPEAFSLRSLCLPTARAQRPAAGVRVPRGAAVTVRQLTCFLGSPVGGDQRAAVVPDLRGRPASAAVAWAERNQLYWELDRLPPLRPSTRPGLLDNYVVTDQRPAAGSLLARGTACPGAATGCFVPTPLVMQARVRR